MRYSVYDPSRRIWDVYEGSGPGGTHAGSPPISWGRHALGATPEQASWKVPAGAVKVGSSDLPQGRIATHGGGALGSYELTDPMTLVVISVAAYFAWKAIR